MMRINLLEVREERRRIALRNLLIVAAVTWVVTIGALVGWHLDLTGQIEAVEARISEEQAQIKQWKPQLDEVREAEKKKKALEARLETIRKLDSGRATMVSLLAAFAEVLPEEVWAQELEVVDRNITMKGEAIDMQSIGVLVKRLKEDPRFEAPATKDIKSSGGRKRVRSVAFTLTVRFVPPSETKEQG